MLILWLVIDIVLVIHLIHRLTLIIRMSIIPEPSIPEIYACNESFKTMSRLSSPPVEPLLPPANAQLPEVTQMQTPTVLLLTTKLA